MRVFFFCFFVFLCFVFCFFVCWHCILIFRRLCECVGMVLHYLNSTMRQKTLCQIFGVSPASTSRTIRHTLPVLLESLRQLPCACIQWPTRETMQQWSEAVHLREPRLKGCFGFVDGVWFPIFTPAHPLEQNAYYNGWKSCHNVANVLVFGADGTIIWCACNYPGSWHDSSVAQALYPLLLNREATPDPYFIVGDTAFKMVGDISTKLHTPLKRDDLSSDAQVRAVQLDSHRAVTSVRQAAEWGMREIQGAFPRTSLRLTTNAQERHMILEVVFRLFNARTRLLQINQTRTVYSVDYFPMIFARKQYSHLHRYYNIDEY